VPQNLSGNTVVTDALKWLVIGSLILTAVCDALAFFIVLVSRRPTLQLLRWR
jgi:hypothetical protein